LLSHIFEKIIGLDNLLTAWKEFSRGKRKKRAVLEFESRLLINLSSLHDDLASGNYRHGGYRAFNVCDPKPRNIHKASVRDRLVHHAVYRILYLYFDQRFIADSYSCRRGKGTHKALNRFRQFADSVSQNRTKTCWILKGDIKKFFASIDQRILKNLLHRAIADNRTLDLLNKIIDSFRIQPGKGLPLGNLTSQLLVNIYLNEFDQFIKHRLKVKHYLRYADDFIIMSNDRSWLSDEISSIEKFLKDKLQLTFHPDKIYIKTLASGVDFLGWVNFSDHRVIRTVVKRRMLKKISQRSNPQVVQSYLGLLKHGNGYKLRQKIVDIINS